MKKVKFKGNQVALAGFQIKPNTPAPYFRAVDRNLNEVSLDNFADKIKIITSFVSLDTPVCDLQVKEFNNRASQLHHDQIQIIGISSDLPFAQNRFCEHNSIGSVTILSDYKYCSFGINYGLLVRELNLIARSILIVDKNNVVRYIQIVEEITDAPDYNDAIDNLNYVIENPTVSYAQDIQVRCKPANQLEPLSMERIAGMFTLYPQWQLKGSDSITKEFAFNNFDDAKYFLDMICVIARDQDHHPVMEIDYNKVRVTLTTHRLAGLTENDFIMARIIDNLAIEIEEPVLK